MNRDYDDLRALYREARGDEEPTRSDKRAVRVALVGAGTAVATFHATTAAGKMLALIPGAGKVLTLGQVVFYAGVGAAVGGGLAAVGATVTHRAPATHISTGAPSHATPTASVHVAVRGVAQASVPPNAAPSSVSISAEENSGSPATRVSIQSSGKNTPSPLAHAGAGPSSAEREALAPTPASKARQPSLVDESRALAAVQSALNAHDGPSALRLLDVQDSEFASGSLVQERAAARVLALCTSGRTSEARSARERFLQAYPGSPLVRRINAACEK